MTGRVQVTDSVIWISHIVDDEPLKAWLASVPAGAAIDLEIAGERGAWRKMKDGADGRPTLGLKPARGADARWRALQAVRDQWVTIALSSEF